MEGTATKKGPKSGVWWHMPVIPDPERLGQEDWECSKPDLAIIASSRLASATGDGVSKQ